MHDQGHAGDTFKADDADFDAMIFIVHRHHRSDADLQQIGMGDGLVRHLDHLALAHRHSFEMRRQKGPVGRREFDKQPVSDPGALRHLYVHWCPSKRVCPTHAAPAESRHCP